MPATGSLPLRAFGLAGFLSHGSIINTLPLGVTISNAEWPCQVIVVSAAHAPPSVNANTNPTSVAAKRAFMCPPYYYRVSRGGAVIYHSALAARHRRLT